MDVNGGAAGTAVAADVADEEEAFGMAANWKEMEKRRGGKTKTTCQNTFLSGKNLISLLAAM